jgi:tetratricopeptide (TPR) repeat protein
VKRLILPACLLLSACASTKPVAVSELRQQAQRTEQAGRAAYQRGNWDAAARQFERAAQTFGAMDDYAGQAAALHNQAQSLRRQGLGCAAYATYGRALAINKRLGRVPEQAQNLDGLAQFLAGYGKLENAIRTMERAIKLMPGDATLQNDLAVLLLQRGNATDRQRILELITGETATARLNRGRAYLQFGDTGMAQKSLEEALAKYRTSDDARGLAETHETLAQLFRAQGKDDRAWFHLEQARQKFVFLKDNAALKRLDLIQP